jgi:hypothetical protein
MDAAQLIASRPEVSVEAKHSNDSGKHHGVKEGEDAKKGMRRTNKKKDEGNGKRRKKLSKMKHYWLGKAKEAKPDSEEDTGQTEPVIASTEGTIEAAALVRPPQNEPSKQELIAAMESVVATLGGTAPQVRCNCCIRHQLSLFAKQTGPSSRRVEWTRCWP